MEGGVLSYSEESLDNTASVGYAATPVKVRRFHECRFFVTDRHGIYPSIWPVSLFFTVDIQR